MSSLLNNTSQILSLCLVGLNPDDLNLSTNSMFFVDNDSPGIIEIISVYISDDATSISEDISIAKIVFKSVSQGESHLKFNRE